MTSPPSGSERLVPPPPPYGRTGPVAGVLALVLPAALVAGVLGWWGRPQEERTEPRPALKSCLQIVEGKDPDVVVIGNSKAASDVDREALAKKLGPDVTVATVSITGTGGHVWYAALSRCVFEAAAPRLVVVYGTVGAALRTRLKSERDRAALLAFEGASLAPIREKVLGGRASPFWGRVEERQSALQTGLQHLVRDGVAGLFFAPPGPDGLLAAGRAYAEPALAEVLGADATADAERAHAIPIAAAADEPAAVAEAATLDDTLLPDIVALAKERGARLVFARGPISDRKTGYDAVDPALVRALVDHLNERGAGYLDLEAEGFPASSFGDGIHMTRAARGELTAALADGLRALDALGTTPFAPAALPRAPAVATRTGTPPTFPALTLKRGPHACGWEAEAAPLAALSDTLLTRRGFGPASPILVLEDGKPLTPHSRKQAFDEACAGASSHQGALVKLSPTGGPAEVAAARTYTLAPDPALPHVDGLGRDAWWVYPGTSLRLDVPEPWAEPGPFAVGFTAMAPISGSRAAELVVTGAAPTPIPARGSDTTVIVDAPPPSGPWSVEIRSPEDGPWLLVESVVAGTPARPWFLLGKADGDRSLALLKGTPEYANPSPLPTITVASPEPLGKAWVVSDTSAIGAPDTADVYALAGIPRCALLRVHEDAEALAGAGLWQVRSKGGGLYTHADLGVAFSTPDGSSPLDNGRTYTVSLDPSRACDTGRWLYPGDEARFTSAPNAFRNTVRESASVLELAAVAFPRPGSPASEARLRVQLVADGVVFLDERVPLATIQAQPPRWTLPTPVPRTVSSVTLALSTPADAPYVLVTGASLVEPGAPAFPAGSSPVAAEQPAPGATTRGASTP